MAKASSVEERVIKILVNQLLVEKEQLTPEANFSDDLGADSLDLVEVIMALEEGFNIDIPEEEAEKIKTVGQAIEAIKAKVKE